MLYFLWQLTRGIVYSKFVHFLFHNPPLLLSVSLSSDAVTLSPSESFSFLQTWTHSSWSECSFGTYSLSLVTILSVSLSRRSLLYDWASSFSAAFFLLHPVLLHKDPNCSQTSSHNLWMIQAVLNWGVAVESWVTTREIRITNMWL